MSSYCCGLHAVCERGLAPAPVPAEAYYEDEELDRFRGRAADAYTDEEVEEFRDVLYTMRADEVGSWLAALQMREIELPVVLREEACMLSEE